MIAIIAKDVEIFTFPIGDMHKGGYDELCKRVCLVRAFNNTWTGSVIAGNQVLTTNFFQHNKEFDIQFTEIETSGFLKRDFGELILLEVPKHPDLNPITSGANGVKVGKRLFVIGSMLGIPFSLAICTIDKIVKCDTIMSDVRLNIFDPYSTGSPVFDPDGGFVGVLIAYIEKTDRMVIRQLVANQQGVLVG